MADEPTGRFATLNETEFKQLLTDKDSKNTRRATESSIRTFRAYLKEKQLSPEFETLPKGELDNLLAKFYTEARQENGSLYKKSSLFSLRHGLNRHLSSVNSFDIIHDADFKNSNRVFSAAVKDLKRNGLGGVDHYPPIEEEDLRKMFNYFDINSNIKLQEKVFVDIVLYFGRRGRENLHELKVSHFAARTDDQGRVYIHFTNDEHSKNLQDDPNTADGRMYSIPDDDMCPVKTFMKYKSHLNPNCDRLFQRPSKNSVSWYDKIPLGHNTIGKFMIQISEKAGLSHRYTNHSLRTTSVHVLDAIGIYANRHMGVTGHKLEDSLKKKIKKSIMSNLSMSDTISESLRPEEPAPTIQLTATNTNDSVEVDLTDPPLLGKKIKDTSHKQLKNSAVEMLMCKLGRETMSDKIGNEKNIPSIEVQQEERGDNSNMFLNIKQEPDTSNILPEDNAHLSFPINNSEQLDNLTSSGVEMYIRPLGKETASDDIENLKTLPSIERQHEGCEDISEIFPSIKQEPDNAYYDNIVDQEENRLSQVSQAYPVSVNNEYLSSLKSKDKGDNLSQISDNIKNKCTFNWRKNCIDNLKDCLKKTIRELESFGAEVAAWVVTEYDDKNSLVTHMGSKNGKEFIKTNPGIDVELHMFLKKCQSSKSCNPDNIVFTFKGPTNGSDCMVIKKHNSGFQEKSFDDCLNKRDNTVQETNEQSLPQSHMSVTHERKRRKLKRKMDEAFDYNSPQSSGQSSKSCNPDNIVFTFKGPTNGSDCMVIKKHNSGFQEKSFDDCLNKRDNTVQETNEQSLPQSHMSVTHERKRRKLKRKMDEAFDYNSPQSSDNEVSCESSEGINHTLEDRCIETTDLSEDSCREIKDTLVDKCLMMISNKYASSTYKEGAEFPYKLLKERGKPWFTLSGFPEDLLPLRHPSEYNVDSLRRILDRKDQIEFGILHKKKRSLHQNEIEPLDDSFTELAETIEDESNLSCEICNKHYQTMSSLKRHIKMHNAEHICKVCYTVFDTEVEFLEHKSKKHSVPYLCSICGKSFKRNSSLTEHIKDHSAKTEKCPFEECGKTFRRKQLLKDHINTHTGVKPYLCDKCKKAFVSQSSFGHHKSNCMKRIECGECKEVFASKSVLYDHVQSKHKVQWFFCKCGKHFRWRTNLARHQKNCSDSV